MAVKRRTIWLRDEEWADVLKIAEIYGTTVSRAIAKGMVHKVGDWETFLRPLVDAPSALLPAERAYAQPKRPAIETLARAKPFLRPAVDQAMQEFRPVPKPGKGR